MIKLCEILAFNKLTHIVVAKYAEVQIQFVTDNDCVGSTAYIKKNGSTYEIVGNAEYEKSLKQAKKIREKINDDKSSNDSELIKKNTID